MGTSRSPDELAGKLNRLAHEYTDLEKSLVTEGAQITKKVISAGAPSRLRGVGRRGARLSVGYNVTSTAATPAALVFARGPWPLIERDTAAHVIPRQRARRRGKGRFAVVPGGSESPPHGKGGVRASVQHPGTRGQRPWAKGVARAEPLVADLFEHRTGFVLRRVF